MADYNTVPLGHAGTGDAVIFGDGLGALRHLERTDALQARLRAQQQAADQRAQQASARDFASRLPLSDKGGLTYMPLLQGKAQQVYDQMLAVTQRPGLSAPEKAVAQQQLRDQYNREAEASVQADKYVGDLAQKAASDKRYDRDKTWNLLHGTQYQDGQLLSPLAYDPRRADQALGTGRDHLNGVEIMKTFVRGDHPDAVTYNQEALPGGRGTRRTAASDFYELSPDGRIVRDPKTNDPVVKATPEALARFDRDPLNRQYLDSYEAEHQQQLAGAVQKMQDRQPLTPEESAVVAREQAPTGRRLDLFKNLLTEQAYGRESTALTNKAAPRPRAAAKTKFTVSGGEHYASGVLGGSGAGGTQGIAHFGLGEPLRRTTSTGEVKPYSANATHGTYVMLSPDAPAQLVTNNSAPQQLDYDSPVVLLRRPNGAVFLPTDPKIMQAATAGNDEPLLEWARAEKAKNPSLRAEPFMLAAQSKRADLDISSPEAAFQQLKAERDRYRKLAEGGQAGLSQAIAQESGSDEEKQQLSQMLQAMSKGKAVHLDTDADLLAKARKLSQQQNATFAIPYSGQEKIRIDANTGYVMRAENGKRAKALQAQVDRVNNRLSGAAPAPAPAYAWRGPLAGQLAPMPAAPKAAPPAPATPAAPANKYGFKFKK